MPLALLPITVTLASSGALGGAACSSTVDIGVFGGTVCGVTAVAGAQRTNSSLSVGWVVSGSRLGGMTSGGLGGLDSGMPIGGFAAQLITPLGHNFEPHVAEEAVEALLEQSNASGHVTLRRRAGALVSVATAGTAPRRIVSATFEGGWTLCAAQYVDCSYEGDLMRLWTRRIR